MKNFGLIGAAGYIAPRHMRAIRDTGNNLACAADTHDSVGILDNFFPDCRFFTEIERFDRHLEKLRRKSQDERVHYLSICSPNYLHDAHIRLALRVKAHAVCEKPLVINPWNLDALKEIEAETGCSINTILQLRLHPTITALKSKLEGERNSGTHDICLTYITRRGRWYHVSWKGSEGKSGGLAMNIGIHFFDMLIWLFGPVLRSELHLRTAERMSGMLELERARVRWLLSLDLQDLPESHRRQEKPAFRSITIDGRELEFSEGFTDLHTRAYEEILAGRGFGIEDSRPSIDLVYRIRHSDIVPAGENAHPFLSKRCE